MLTKVVITGGPCAGKSSALSYIKACAEEHGYTVLTVAETALAQTSLPFDLYRQSGSVCALSAGRVLEVGTDLHLGKYVIIDHGRGLYTWYAGLAEQHVMVGDVVAVSQTIGIAGNALYHEDSVLIMATLGKATISIDYLCENGYQTKMP